jgi:hypothetical protein
MIQLKYIVRYTIQSQGDQYEAMAKHSHKNTIDIVSETQQNSKWFLGGRSRVFWSDMTPAEWSRYRRNYPLQRIINLISFIIFGIPLTIGSIVSISSGKFSESSITMGVITILVWIWIILAWNNTVKKPKD